MVIVPDDLVRRWEVAYKRYGEALGVSAAGDGRIAARAVASSSLEVAVVYREMGSRVVLPWWMAAAVGAAAEAFECQARDWGVRGERIWPTSNGALDGSPPRVPDRPQPQPQRHGERR